MKQIINRIKYYWRTRGCMITKKQNEAILYLRNNDRQFYLSKLFKLMYFLQLEIYRTKKEYFFKTDFIIDPIAPIPKVLWDNIINKKFFEKYPNCYEFIVPKGKKLNFRNIKDFKIFAQKQADLSEFSKEEIDILNKIILIYKNLPPSQMNEKLMFPKCYYKKMIEEGMDGKIINFEELN